MPDRLLDELLRDPGFRRWFEAMSRLHDDVAAWLATKGVERRGHVLGGGTVTVFDELGGERTFRLPLRLRLRLRWIALRYSGRGLARVRGRR